MINDLPRALGERAVGELPFGGTQLGALVTLVEDGTIAPAAARDVLAEMVKRGGEPRELVERFGLTPLDDSTAIEALVAHAVAQNADKAAAYRAGRTGLIGFFVGAVVKASNGRADPQLVKELVARLLASTG
jgi:glutaminyl-tRNA synthetase